MDKPGIDEFECKKVFSTLGLVIAGTRLASVTDSTIESLQLLARGAGEPGVTVYISERNDPRGMHPRLDSVHYYANPDFPETDLQAGADAAGHAITFGWRTPAANVINLFFDLDVGRLPFEEAIRLTSAKRLAAAPQPATCKGVARRR